MSNQRACSRVYPCKVAQGTVFVFASPDHELSDITPLPLVPGLDEEDYSGVRAIRELPYGWDTLIENVADPSHVPFAHHGIQGNRAKAVPINMQVESGVGPNGMSTTWEVRAPGAKTPRAVAQLCFQAPARLTYTTDIKVGKLAGKKFLLHAYCIPVAPGRSRLMFRAGSNVGGLFSLLLKITPRWYDHIERNDVLSGDLVLLHKQERLLRQGGDPGGGDWKSRFYTPAAADLMVNLFREWIDRFGQPAWVPGTDPALPPELLDRRQLLDLQSQHTDHCASCRAAQKRFQSITVLLAAIGLVLLGSTSLYVGNTKVVKSLLLAGLGACAAAFAAWRAERHIFVFRDYVHAFR